MRRYTDIQKENNVNNKWSERDAKQPQKDEEKEEGIPCT